MRNRGAVKTWVALAVMSVGLAALFVYVSGWGHGPVKGLMLDELAEEDIVQADRGLEFVPEGGAAGDSGSPMQEPAADRRQSVVGDASSVIPDECVGKLIVWDADGVELPQESGELMLRSIGGATQSASILVPFLDGGFSLIGLPEGKVRIERATVIFEDGKRPVAFEENQFELDFDNPPILIGHYLPDCTLRVVDALTGVDLDGIFVLPKLPGHAGPEQSSPGPHFSPSRVAMSPVLLPPRRGIQSYWVRAKGYTWRFVKIDHETGGERKVMLERAGRLIVEVVGHEDGVELYLRVYHHETRKLAASCRVNRSSDGSGTQGFPGLAEGKYDVRAELGPVDGDLLVLGEVQVDVSAFEVARALIKVDDDHFPPVVSVNLELVLSSNHRDLDYFISLRPAEGPTLRRNDVQRFSMGGSRESGVLTWSPDPLTPGRYLLVVEPIQHRVLFEVPRTPPDNFTFRVTVPGLFPVTLHVIDVETRQPIQGATLRCSREFQAGLGADPWVEIKLEPGRESTTLYLPAGPFAFAASSPKHSEKSLKAHIGTGSDQLTLELSPCISREIILLYGNTLIPWTRGMTSSFSPLGSKDSYPCESFGDGRKRAYFKRPGIYEVAVGQLEGFRNLEPVVVSVSWGDLSPIQVRIVR